MTLVLAVVLLGSAVLLLGRALAGSDRPTGLARSIAALEDLGTPSAELTAEAERPFSERVLEPLQGRALGVGRRLIGADKAERIRRKLEMAGNPAGLTVDRVVSFKVIGAVAAPVLALLYCLVLGLGLTTLLVVVATAALLGFMGVDIYLSQVRAKRDEKIKRALPDAVDLLTISVEAGLAFDGALQQVAAKTEGPLAQEFSRVLREMQLGAGRGGALRSLGERTGVDDLKTFVSAMVQADAFGIPIGQVLRVQSSEMRVKRRQAAETKAQQVPVKITIPVILCILPCLFIIVMGPAAISAMDAFSGAG